MKLIVGLGNPDGKYKNTYHNTGFNAVDFFVNKIGHKFTTKKCKAEICKGDGFIVAKPQTYMNLSGDSVYELKKYFKISLNDILIVYIKYDAASACKLREFAERRLDLLNSREIIEMLGLDIENYRGRRAEIEE